MVGAIDDVPLRHPFVVNRHRRDQCHFGAWRSRNEGKVGPHELADAYVAAAVGQRPHRRLAKTVATILELEHGGAGGVGHAKVVGDSPILGAAADLALMELAYVG